MSQHVLLQEAYGLSLGILKIHKYYIELCLTETARSLYSHAYQVLVSSAGGLNEQDIMDTRAGNSLGFDRLYFSRRSVVAIKAWMETFFSLSRVECVALSFIYLAQLARCLMVLYRLSTFVHPGWDCAVVRNTLDILSVLDNVAK